MKLPFKIKQVKPCIFLFEFIDKYDLCMHFLRYQEYYESPSSKFRNKNFTILDYMEWQAKTQGSGNFTYTTLWAGFNFPSQTMLKCMDNIIDVNKYDENMNEAYSECLKKIGKFSTIDNKFYIIGAMKDDYDILNHEVAHGMFYLNSAYKKEMTKLVGKLPVKICKYMKTMLTEMGYTERVFIDETQAYFSTTESMAEYLYYTKTIRRSL